MSIWLLVVGTPIVWLLGMALITSPIFPTSNMAGEFLAVIVWTFICIVGGISIALSI